jgi:hypothetical protein
MPKFRLKEFHARYDPSESAFLCLLCQKSGLELWVYDAWEIPKHLKKSHKICRKNQSISGWNQTFENEYLKNRKKPVTYHDDDSIIIDKTPDKELEKDRKRIIEELKAKRDSR